MRDAWSVDPRQSIATHPPTNPPTHVHPQSRSQRTPKSTIAQDHRAPCSQTRSSSTRRLVSPGSTQTQLSTVREVITICVCRGFATGKKQRDTSPQAPCFCIARPHCNTEKTAALPHHHHGAYLDGREAQHDAHVGGAAGLPDVPAHGHGVGGMYQGGSGGQPSHEQLVFQNRVEQSNVLLNFETNHAGGAGRLPYDDGAWWRWRCRACREADEGGAAGAATALPVQQFHAPEQDGAERQEDSSPQAREELVAGEEGRGGVMGVLLVGRRARKRPSIASARANSTS